MGYNPTLGLIVADTCLLAFYALLLGYEIFVIVKYLAPLRITSTYILLFYFLLSVLLSSSIIELFPRMILA